MTPRELHAVAPRSAAMRLTSALVLSALVLLGACSSDGRELADPVFPPPATDATSTTTLVILEELPGEPTSPPAESSPEGSEGSVTFDRLDSPANATAEVTGTGALFGDPVTVDGEPADLLSFDAADDGAFTARIWIEDEGAHTVCVADTCARVFTLAPDAETAEEVIAKIEAAPVLAAEIFPYDELFPEWSIEIGGALSGTGGTADADRQVVTVYRNRGRTVDDFVRTLLHEYGHVVDAERLDDASRAEYMLAAGYTGGTPWRDPDARRLHDWARQPAEDFAEVFVAAWTDGRWLPRTRETPSDELLVTVLALSGF